MLSAKQALTEGAFYFQMQVTIQKIQKVL